MKKPTVILHLEGGIPRIVSDQEIELIILDDDMEGLDEQDRERIYDIPVNVRQTLEYYLQQGHVNDAEYSPAYVETVKEIINK